MTTAEEELVGPRPLEPEEPVRVKVHPGLCEGWGECARWGHGVYHLDEHGKVDLHVADVPPELAFRAWMGAEACPEHAITVIGPSRDYWWELIRRRRAAGEHTH